MKRFQVGGGVLTIDGAVKPPAKIKDVSLEKPKRREPTAKETSFSDVDMTVVKKTGGGGKDDHEFE